MSRPRIDSITIRTAPTRRRRKYGDLKVINDVQHVCRHVRCKDTGALYATNGRLWLQWVPVSEDRLLGGGQ